MRIWSIHPGYLDSKGLVALWREALLAKNILEGKTKGYKNHPQLERFKMSKKPLDSINQYLQEVFRESRRRKYDFDGKKINWNVKGSVINVTQGQIVFEIQHLMNKLKVRDKVKYTEIKSLRTFECHPLFKIIDGDIEKWEKPGKIKKVV
jgi:hypothetical protein